MSSAQMAQLSGRGPASGQGSSVVNIQYAFGDRRAMTKLVREITRVQQNDSSVIR